MCGDRRSPADRAERRRVATRVAVTGVRLGAAMPRESRLHTYARGRRGRPTGSWSPAWTSSRRRTAPADVTGPPLESHPGSSVGGCLSRHRTTFGSGPVHVGPARHLTCTASPHVDCEDLFAGPTAVGHQAGLVGGRLRPRWRKLLAAGPLSTLHVEGGHPRVPLHQTPDHPPGVLTSAYSATHGDARVLKVLPRVL